MHKTPAHNIYFCSLCITAWETHCLLNVCPHFQYLLARLSVFSPRLCGQHCLAPAPTGYAQSFISAVLYYAVDLSSDLLITKQRTLGHIIFTLLHFCHVPVNDSLPKPQLSHLSLEVWNLFYMVLWYSNFFRMAYCHSKMSGSLQLVEYCQIRLRMKMKCPSNNRAQVSPCSITCRQYG